MSRGSNPDDRRVEVPKALLRDMSGDLGSEATELHSLMNDDNPIRLLYRSCDCVSVKRSQRSWIDNLDADALALECSRRPQRMSDHRAKRDHRHISTLPRYASLS